MFSNFQPARFFRNAHVQTVFPTLWQGKSPNYRATPHLVQLPDGDQVVMHEDCPENWKPGDPVVLMSHGLVGDHRSPYLSRIAHKLNLIGFRTFRLDLRNCGAGFGLAQHPYHAARSEDFLHSISKIEEMAPDSPVSLVGFSLSGTIALRTIAETPDELPKSLVTAVAVNPPVDLARSVQTLNSGFGKIYDRYFTKKLLSHIEALHAHRPDIPKVNFERTPRTIFEFDHHYTAPLIGFEGAEHYYQEASSSHLLDRIKLRSMILTAADDPVIPVEMFEEVKQHPMIELVVANFGGHLGYRGKPGVDPDHHWMDWRVIDWLKHYGTGEETAGPLTLKLPNPIENKSWNVYSA